MTDGTLYIGTKLWGSLAICENCAEFDPSLWPAVRSHPLMQAWYAEAAAWHLEKYEAAP